jgi:hypothetical protein
VGLIYIVRVDDAVVHESFISINKVWLGLVKGLIYIVRVDDVVGHESFISINKVWLGLVKGLDPRAISQFYLTLL